MGVIKIQLEEVKHAYEYRCTNCSAPFWIDSFNAQLSEGRTLTEPICPLCGLRYSTELVQRPSAGKLIISSPEIEAEYAAMYDEANLEPDEAHMEGG